MCSVHCAVDNVHQLGISSASVEWSVCNNNDQPLASNIRKQQSTVCSQGIWSTREVGLDNVQHLVSLNTIWILESGDDKSITQNVHLAPNHTQPISDSYIEIFQHKCNFLLLQEEASFLLPLYSPSFPLPLSSDVWSDFALHPINKWTLIRHAAIQCEFSTAPEDLRYSLRLERGAMHSKKHKVNRQ